MAAVAEGNRQIAVAGNLGAGKTTLVDGLCAHLGWSRCPARSPDPAYVQRIHSDPSRWSFEAQLNFLTLKATAIREAHVDQRNAVIDRSIYEDRETMAKSWAEKYWDEQTRTTYDNCARMLIEGLPAPDVVLYCHASREVRGERRANRPRGYQVTYDPLWVERLDALYADWAGRFDACPLLELDTDHYDVRDPRVVRGIITDLQAYFAPGMPSQTILFDLSGAPPPTPLFDYPEQLPTMRLLRPANTIAPHTRGDLIAPTAASELLPRLLPHPSVYVAAPFTALAVAAEPLREDLRLPVSGRAHGIIPDEYRKSLERVVAAIDAQGFFAVLPHRDVNRWGHRSLPARQVAQACVQLVGRCDVFVGILGKSFGAHLEAGVALALNKPCLFIEVEQFGGTFVGGGLGLTAGARRIKVARLDDVPSRLAVDELLLATA